jgi:hypothetical protein
MCLIVYLGQMLEIKVRIHLRRGYVGVPQKLLNTAQIMARLEQVRREGVSKQVRVYVGVDTLLARPVTDAGLHRSGTDSRTTITHKQRPFIGGR